MAWPTPQDYNEAIQHPKVCFLDPELRGGTPELNVLGLPKVASGNFASVYRMRCRGKDWAVRCFSNRITDQESRYEQLSRFIMTDDLVYTVNFEYQPNGMKLLGASFPIVKMEWVEGDPILQWIEKRLDEPHRIVALAESFAEMMRQMQDAGIAHGDLQHGNVLIVDNDFRLVDYDGMYVPSMQDMASNELGHPNYQHPKRSKEHFGNYLDNFSAWVIFLSLQIIARDSSIWHKLNVGDERILFGQADYRSPKTSQVFALLLEHENRDIASAAELVMQLTQIEPHQVPPLTMALSNLQLSQLKMVPAWKRWARKIEHWWLTQSKPQKRPEVRQPIQSPTPAPIKTSTTRPEWLDDWIKNTPPPPPPAPPASTLPPPVPVPTITLFPQSPPISDQQSQQAPKGLSSVDLQRLLSTARSWAGAYQFKTANDLLQLVDENREEFAPKTQIDILKTTAEVKALEADHYLRNRKINRASQAYSQAIDSLLQAIKVRNTMMENNEQAMLARLYEGAASCYEMDGQFALALVAYEGLLRTLTSMRGTELRLKRVQSHIAELKTATAPNTVPKS